MIYLVIFLLVLMVVGFIDVIVFERLPDEVIVNSPGWTVLAPIGGIYLFIRHAVGKPAVNNSTGE